ncbi:hypothetical protein Clocel_0121 [Clostridium cellulovorans 743B]|uniref:Uncharacterized protein n=1 Tax=Clostridium cellulovorans (strain ATCC 35296 / DSM 3052 / OCM 3 / 743B) TaxID=573061 RepID=D9SNN9_CLOC7|nr:hypothetical protein Clocel_0121 [Clostridium cellulovorans 743B]
MNIFLDIVRSQGNKFKRIALVISVHMYNNDKEFYNDNEETP